MSSSASPSAASSAEYAEQLSNLVTIPSLSHENHYFLGPIGNLDPTEFIIGETNRIPFRLANPNLGHWKNTFKSWPSLEKTSPEKSWVTWYKRVSASKQTHWDEIGIGQALALTIANSAKDEPLIAAATYFWSNTINAFLFNKGPMTPTLIDITMITGLDVTSSASPMIPNTKNQYDFRTKSIGGWSSYVAAYVHGPRIGHSPRTCGFSAYVARKIPLLWIELWPHNQLAVCSRGPRNKKIISSRQNPPRLPIPNVE
uniref:Aminotransferase-like plant mobile domain-containing protein n=1 Tax=Oryza sativa subsp. japonica TaxID=39947 RepID=Q53K76_ORYSJ|nr:hypothetical protein [Oryza sativa Japonica Group]